jgi:hypothetical protein
MSIELETVMRQVDNIPGVVYDAEKTTQNFAEDHNSLVDAINELAGKSGNFSGAYPISILPDQATQQLNFDDYKVFNIELKRNVTLTFDTLNFENLETEVKIYVKQDGTGGRTLTLPNNIIWLSNTTYTATSGANKMDIVKLRIINNVIYGTFEKDYFLFGGYIFNTSAAIDTAIWKEITNAQNIGTAWVFTSGQAGRIAFRTSGGFGTVCPIVGSKDITLLASMNFPASNLSATGCSIEAYDSNNTYTNRRCSISTSWDNQPNYIAYTNNGNTNTNIAGGNTIAIKIIIKTTGRAELYVNNTLIRAQDNQFNSGDRLSVSFFKYTETTGYVFYGSIEYL